MLPNYKVLERKLETLSFEETVKLEENRLKAKVSYRHERPPFWRKKFDAIGLRKGLLIRRNISGKVFGIIVPKNVREQGYH